MLKKTVSIDSWDSPWGTQKPRRRPLLILLLTVSAALLVTGSSIGMLYDSRIDPNTTVMISSLNIKDLNTSLQISIFQYTNSDYKFAWNKMQMQLNCCGIGDYRDWLNVGRPIPDSCCENVKIIPGDCPV
ncbi:hypothetical protein NQ314_018203 [Rhamnusium bicolor]|uniref:Uncharacterized protein n=1 Tax=Rhamnusium bicolor TaxID=1586634 RepID=A0AAV8WSY4_9CUCU|nr:hypothetical protein NQ314_018203 [Rhamnusium bicolor]